MSDSAPITWFTEDPTMILVIGGLILLVLGGFFLKSGRVAILLAMAGVALVMGAAVVIDRLVVTDREAVANTIYDAAALAEKNDFKTLFGFISPSAPEVKAEAQRWIGGTKLKSVSISAMEVTVNHAAKPMTGTAEFRVFATGERSEKTVSYEGNYLTRLHVDLRKEGDRWMVTGYERDR
jgi:hypothetical protein